MQYGTPCNTAAVFVRSSFLRVPPNHTYAVETQTNNEFDRFGLFRTYERTYVRGGQDVSTLHKFCRTNADCGPDNDQTGNHVCDTSKHYCVGGLTDDQGETDFLTFYRPRHDFWRDQLTDKSCVADWECDGRYGNMAPGQPGSVCDPAARRCTVPLKDRPTHTVDYYLSPGFPRHLVKAAFHVVGDWNKVFMQGERLAKGKDLPQGPSGGVACQSDDPTQYCYCGSPEDTGGMCPWQYDPFMSPADQAAAGVTNPFNCYIKPADGYTDPQHPTSWDDYAIPGVYGYTFTSDPAMGDSECMLVLHSNTCDMNRTDPLPNGADAATVATACDAVSARTGKPYEQLGDIRYQFFNYVQNAHLQFGGVSMPLVDPKTGELIVSNANLGGESIDAVGTWAQTYFPALRCASAAGCGPNDDPNGLPGYLSGTDLRKYQEALGRVQNPAVGAVSGTDGYQNNDPSRPALPVALNQFIRSQIGGVSDKIQSLGGPQGRARIFSDRMSQLAGDPQIESRMVDSIGAGGHDLMMNLLNMPNVAPGTTATDASVIDKVSPFRSGFLDSVEHQRKRWQILERYNMDPPVNAAELSNPNYQYWAEAFRNMTLEEASIRTQQMFTRTIMHHEMGHSMGLRHNFAGSLDRNNYATGYFNIAEDLPLPLFQDYDDPSNGGNGDGQVTGDEMNRYLADLRHVRDERNKRGIGNTMTASTMDYNGDSSDQQGLGRYDVAAAILEPLRQGRGLRGRPGPAFGHHHTRWARALRHDAAHLDDLLPRRPDLQRRHRLPQPPGEPG